MNTKKYIRFCILICIIISASGFAEEKPGFNIGFTSCIEDLRIIKNRIIFENNRIKIACIDIRGAGGKKYHSVSLEDDFLVFGKVKLFGLFREVKNYKISSPISDVYSDLSKILPDYSLYKSENRGLIFKLFSERLILFSFDFARKSEHIGAEFSLPLAGDLLMETMLIYSSCLPEEKKENPWFFHVAQNSGGEVIHLAGKLLYTKEWINLCGVMVFSGRRWKEPGEYLRLSGELDFPWIKCGFLWTRISPGFVSIKMKHPLDTMSMSGTLILFPESKCEIEILIARQYRENRVINKYRAGFSTFFGISGFSFFWNRKRSGNEYTGGVFIDTGKIYFDFYGGGFLSDKFLFTHIYKMDFSVKSGRVKNKIHLSFKKGRKLKASFFFSTDIDLFGGGLYLKTGFPDDFELSKISMRDFSFSLGWRFNARFK